MKLTSSQLKKIIAEEVKSVRKRALRESYPLGAYASPGAIGDVAAAFDKLRIEVERAAMKEGMDAEEAADVALASVEEAFREYMAEARGTV